MESHTSADEAGHGSVGASALRSTSVDIADQDSLYRRIVNDHVDADGNVNSAAFRQGGSPERKISVDLASLTTPEAVASRAGRPGFGVASLIARVPRELEFEVRHDPLPHNYAHSLIEGENDRKKCRLLAEACTVLIPPARG